MYKSLAKISAGVALTGIVGFSSGGAYSYFTQKPFDGSFLSEDINFSTSYSEDKIGNLYGNFLIGAYGEDNRNKVGWDSSYRQGQLDLKNSIKKSRLSDEFGEDKIKSAFSKKGDTSEDADKALNRVCAALYEKNKSDIEGDDNNKPKLRIDIGRYCSYLGEDIKRGADRRIKSRKLFGY